MSSPMRRSRSYTPPRRFKSGSRSRSGASRSPSPPRTADSRTPSRTPSRRSRSARSRSPRGGSRSSRERSFEMKRPSGDRERPEPNTCLGVFGLSFKTTEQDLEHKFGKFGPLEKVNLVLDGPSRRSRGFGFIYYERQEDATRARDAMDGQELQGFKLRVDYSITREAHKPTPGVYFHHGKAHKPGDRSKGNERRSGRRGGGRPPSSGRSSYRDERPSDYYRPRERAPYPEYDRDYYDRPYYREDKYYDPPPPRRDDRYREDRYYEDRYYRDREFDRSRYYDRERERRYERTPPPPAYPRYDSRDRYPPPMGKMRPSRRSPSPRMPRQRY